MWLLLVLSNILHIHIFIFYIIINKSNSVWKSRHVFHSMHEVNDLRILLKRFVTTKPFRQRSFRIIFFIPKSWRLRTESAGITNRNFLEHILFSFYPSQRYPRLTKNEPFLHMRSYSETLDLLSAWLIIWFIRYLFIH